MFKTKSWNLKTHICKKHTKPQAPLTYWVLKIYTGSWHNKTPPSATQFFRLPSQEQTSSNMPERRPDFQSNCSSSMLRHQLFTYYSSDTLCHPGKTLSPENTFLSYTSLQPYTGLVSCRSILEQKRYLEKVAELEKKPTCCLLEKNGNRLLSSAPTLNTCFAFFIF